MRHLSYTRHEQTDKILPTNNDTFVCRFIMGNSHSSLQNLIFRPCMPMVQPIIKNTTKSAIGRLLTLVLFFLVLYVIFGVRFDSIWGAIPLSLLIIGIIACTARHQSGQNHDAKTQ